MRLATRTGGIVMALDVQVVQRPSLKSPNYRGLSLGSPVFSKVAYRSNPRTARTDGVAPRAWAG